MEILTERGESLILISGREAVYKSNPGTVIVCRKWGASEKEKIQYIKYLHCQVHQASGSGFRKCRAWKNAIPYHQPFHTHTNSLLDIPGRSRPRRQDIPCPRQKLYLTQRAQSLKKFILARTHEKPFPHARNNHSHLKSSFSVWNDHSRLKCSIPGLVFLQPERARNEKVILEARFEISFRTEAWFFNTVGTNI